MAGSQLKVWDRESMGGPPQLSVARRKGGFSYLCPIPPAVSRLQKFLL